MFLNTIYGCPSRLNIITIQVQQKYGNLSEYNDLRTVYSIGSK
jgi:hypothetical protein